MRAMQRTSDAPTRPLRAASKRVVLVLSLRCCVWRWPLTGRKKRFVVLT